MRKILALLLILLLSACSKSTDKMVGQIWIETPNGCGTGFILTDEYAVTNYHVVQMTRDIKIHLGDTAYSVDKTRCNVAADIAFLTLPYKIELPETDLEFNIGDKVYMYDMVYDRRIKGKIKGTEKKNGYEYIRTDLPTGPGNSGSAILNKEGKIIAIHTFTRGKDSFELPLKYVIEQLE